MLTDKKGKARPLVDGLSTEAKQDDIISQIESTKLSVLNSIDETAYDLNAAAFNETTDIDNDYILDSLELNFSTAEAKTITVLSSDGTILWGGDVDTTSQNLGYNTTAKNFNLCFGQSFNGGENITVQITQTTGACSCDVILKTKQGSAGLAGSPVLGSGSNTVGKVYITDGIIDLGIDSRSGALKKVDYQESRVHDGKHFFVKDVYDIGASATEYVMFTTPNTDTRIHAFVALDAEAEFDVYIYEGGTVSDNGSAITYVNND